MAIQTLAYKMVMDTSSFVDGVSMSRKELAASKKLFEDTRTPLEQYEMALKGLESLQAKGLNADVVQRAMDKLKREYLDTTESMTLLEAEANDLRSTFGRDLFGRTEAEVKQLGDALEEVQPQVTTFGKMFQASFWGNVASNAVTRGLGMATDSVRAFARNVADEFTRIEEASLLGEKLGIRSRTLAGMQRAAQASDVEFDTFVNALQRMSVEIGKAALEGGEAEKQLDRLGLTVKDLLGLSADEKFLKISDAMRNNMNETERLAAAQQLFGRSNTDMVRLLDITNESLSQFTNEMNQTGQALSEVDQYSIRIANDSIDKLNNSLEGLYAKAAVNLGPQVQNLANAFDSFASSLGWFTGTDARTAIDAITTLFVTTSTGGSLGKNFASIVQQRYDAAGQAKESIEQQQKERERELGDLATKQYEDIQKLIDAKTAKAAPEMSSDVMYRQGKSLSEDAYRKQKKDADELQRLYDEFGKELDRVIEEDERKQKQLLIKQQQVRDRMESEGARVTRQFGSPQQRLMSQSSELVKLFRQGVIDSDTFNRAMNSEVGKISGVSGTSGPTTAVLKGSTEAFAAERERARIEDDRYREEVRRETLKLEVLSEIRNNTKPENQTRLDVVEV